MIDNNLYLQARKDYEAELLQAAENGTPITINGRAWFLKSDIQNLRDIFDDIKAETEESNIDPLEEIKQSLFNCVSDLILTDKTREEIGSNILHCLAQLDNLKAVD